MPLPNEILDVLIQVAREMGWSVATEVVEEDQKPIKGFFIGETEWVKELLKNKGKFLFLHPQGPPRPN